MNINKEIKKTIIIFTYLFSIWFIWFVGFIRSAFSGIVMLLVIMSHLLLLHFSEKISKRKAKEGNR